LGPITYIPSWNDLQAMKVSVQATCTAAKHSLCLLKGALRLGC